MSATSASTASTASAVRIKDLTVEIARLKADPRVAAALDRQLVAELDAERDRQLAMRRAALEHQFNGGWTSVSVNGVVEPHPFRAFFAEMAGQAPAPDRPEPETAAARLRPLAAILKGKEKRIVGLLVAGGGRARVADLGVEFNWRHPTDNWGKARGRLNKKLKRHGIQLVTRDGAAVVEFGETGRK